MTIRVSSYHPRIETSKFASFQTTRCRNSELWFANNPELENAILGYAAKYQDRYDITLYAFAIEGNHIQFPAHFPKLNRGDFMRDLNSSVARAVPRFVEEYPGGRLYERRYSNEFLPGEEDIENWFFYTVLQCVQDGLVPKISEYPFYNCFHDAVWGIEREVTVMNWTAYNAVRRYNPLARKKDYEETYTLKYARLPGYEHLSQKEYATLMHKKLEERRQKIVAERLAKGLGFLGREALLQVVRGSRPYRTKKSTRDSHRPRVLSICPVRREATKSWYFDIYFRFKAASLKFRRGELLTEFPPGTYRPSLWVTVPQRHPPPT